MKRLVPLAVLAMAGGAAAAIAATPADATTVPACTGHQLQVFVTDEQGATGHGSLVVEFRNAGSRTCTLTGYPGFDALASNGHLIRSARRTVDGFAGGSRHGVRSIVVHPHGWASATVEWLNFNPRTSGPCITSTTIATTPANTAKTVHRRISVSTCDLQVHPTVAGRSGDS